MQSQKQLKIKAETKYLKLEKAHKNNLIISDMNLGDKYTEFEQAKLRESEILLYEIKKLDLRKIIL